MGALLFTRFKKSGKRRAPIGRRLLNELVSLKGIFQTPRACMASHLSSQSESQLSINETASELFYDAEEYLRSEGESSDSENVSF